MNFKPFIYLNKEEQEKEAAREIIMYTSMGQLDSIRLATKVDKFKHTFPNSIYIPTLTSLTVLYKKDYALALFSNENGLNELGVLKVTNLTDITKMYLGGKAVLLDFWATWCAPCLKEFNYHDELDSFLKDNNIGTIYVSIDFGGNYNQWKQKIIAKKLEGFHYLATPELAKQLSYFKESYSIPRFILIDKDGNVIIDKCELPSSGKLIPQIKEKLGLQ